MRVLWSVLALGSFASPLRAQLVTSDKIGAMNRAIEAAASAAQPWLGLVDAGRTDEAWSQLSVVLRQDSATAWLAKLRPPTGRPYSVTHREVLSIQYSTHRPPFQYPEFVRFEFAVKYNNETLGGEELVVVRDQDGTWRVGNYARRAGPYQTIPGDPPGSNVPPGVTGTPGTRY